MNAMLKPDPESEFIQALHAQLARVDQAWHRLLTRDEVRSFLRWQALWQETVERWKSTYPPLRFIQPGAVTNIRAYLLRQVPPEQMRGPGDWAALWDEVDGLQSKLDSLVPDPSILFGIQAELQEIENLGDEATRLLRRRVNTAAVGYPLPATQIRWSDLIGLCADRLTPRIPSVSDIQEAQRMHRQELRAYSRYDEAIEPAKALQRWQAGISAEQWNQYGEGVDQRGHRLLRYWLGFRWGQTPKPPRAKATTILVDTPSMPKRIGEEYRVADLSDLITGLRSFSQWAESLDLPGLDLEAFWQWHLHDGMFCSGRRFALSGDFAIVIFANKVTLEMTETRAQAFNEYLSLKLSD